MISDSEIKKRILSNARRVFIQRITGNMRAVKMLVDSRIALIDFIIDGEISEDDEENVSEFETEMLSHFLENVVRCKTTRIDTPFEIIVHKNEIVLYARKECENYLNYSL